MPIWDLIFIWSLFNLLNNGLKQYFERASANMGFNFYFIIYLIKSFQILNTLKTHRSDVITLAQWDILPAAHPTRSWVRTPSKYKTPKTPADWPAPQLTLNSYNDQLPKNHVATHGQSATYHCKCTSVRPQGFTASARAPKAANQHSRSVQETLRYLAKYTPGYNQAPSTHRRNYRTNCPRKLAI